MSSFSKQLSFSFAGRKMTSPSTEIRLALLGKTGSGKSSTANSILGRKVFDSRVSSSSNTQRCRRACGEFRGRHLTLLDTPGLLATHQTPQEVQRELRRSVSLLYPGPHVFLLVIQIGRFTQEEKEALQQIKQAMGLDALSFSVVVFTHGDLLEEGRSAKHCLIDECRDLANLVAACGGRYCIFNNTSKNKEQVSELLALVENMIQANGGVCYASKMLQKAEEDLDEQLQEERRLMDEKELQLKKQQEATVKVWYEQELEMLQQKSQRELEELKKAQELEKMEEERLARDREEAFRQMMEENEKKEKERKIQEMVRMMEIRREEEEKREALQEQLDKITEVLEEKADWEEKMRRSMEEKILKERADNEKKERERQLQQLQKEQAIRQREEMKREALQKELEKLTHSLEEQRRKEEDRKRQMEDLLRREKDERQRERDIHMENQMAEKRRMEALRDELKLVKTNIEQRRMREETLRRQMEESLRIEREKCCKEKSVLRKECEAKTIRKTSADKHSAVTTVTGYVQEMGLLGLNAALEGVGAPCCIQ